MTPSTVADAVSSALALPPVRPAEVPSGIDVNELRDELDAVAEDALAARSEGLGLAAAARCERFPALRLFHQALRDALFVEIPRELEAWVEGLRNPTAARETAAGSTALGQAMLAVVNPPASDGPAAAEVPARQRALAELLIFESVRLRLLVASWHSEAFERLGGEESNIDDIAWAEVEALMDDPAVLLPGVRPLQVMFAAASVSLARDAAERADELLQVSGDAREELSMRAKLRAALRELRLPESVLLENALSGLLGRERVELPALQSQRPIALSGLSRQAMDQRVSRGRRALARASSAWPRRQRPALFDLLRNGPA